MRPASRCRSPSPARSPMPPDACSPDRRPRRSGTRSATRSRCSSGSIARSAAGSCGPTSRSSRPPPATPTCAPIRMPDCRTRSASTTSRRRIPPTSCASTANRGWSTSSAAAAAPRPSTSACCARRLAGRAPRRLAAAQPVKCRLAGLEPLNIDDDSLFVNVGERTNVTGSAKFRKLIEAERLRRRARDRAPAGSERRADDRCQHGRGHAGFGSRHGALPAPGGGGA